ncbi:citrate lyase subunit alpha [Rhodobacteraceae bacterium RKSG542]|uniref:citrate lyase subunit alpha n=1 Tax=Pseudovibrio flavus TaxID=2529854 RepID=UPI0012BB72B0|nr:citrate lyase subunit alpha [Pseudovibrio flavus]MTI15937.1 citrate lyase subunit alpha [Pseudovibrio flavus]
MKNRILASLRDAIQAAGLKDGMTVSFHHHLRNGDFVLDMVMREIAALGIKDIRVSASSIFNAHKILVDLAKEEVVTAIDTNYMSGAVPEAISKGLLSKPVMFRSHGGRPRAIEEGSLKIDVAFIAAPTVDRFGNVSGAYGPSACGTLGYPQADAEFADKVVVVTDNIVDYGLEKIAISQANIDFIVKVDRIGDPKGIVSGTTQMTRDPVALRIAEYAAKTIEAAGLLNEGFNFQTGAGGASLATAAFVRERMKEKKLQGGYLLGGVTGYFVNMLEEGTFRDIYDVQCFDLPAIASLARNAHHHEITASQYANPNKKSCFVNGLDAVLLGATEIDENFNVNVHTNSNNVIIGGSGGHADAAFGANLTIIVAPLLRARLPIVVEKVGVVSTPGDTVDVLVTEYGVTPNPRRPELIQQCREEGLPVIPMEELRKMAITMAGEPLVKPAGTRVIADVEYRDGRIIDQITI